MESPALARFQVGGGHIERSGDGWRLALGPTGGYGDAQLDDTHGRSRRSLPHRPPIRLMLEARASSPAPGGTLGFGFWNDPFPTWGGEAGARRALPASPQALWFFHASPPSELPFSRFGPGSGWTAAAYRGPPLPGAAIGAMGAAGMAAMTVPRLRPFLLSRYWSLFEGEQSLALGGLEAWHAYQIEWQPTSIRFLVDEQPVLESRILPRGPLGLVIWIDNQWASLSAVRGLRFGVLPALPEAWLEVRHLQLDGRPLEVGEAAHGELGRDRR